MASVTRLTIDDYERLSDELAVGHELAELVTPLLPGFSVPVKRLFETD